MFFAIGLNGRSIGSIRGYAASIRSSIGIARLAGQRSMRLGTDVDNGILADAARLILQEAIQMKPGRDIESFLDSVLSRNLGVKGKSASSKKAKG